MIPVRIIIFAILTLFLIILSYLLLEVLDKRSGKLLVSIIVILIIVDVILLGKAFIRITGSRNNRK